MRALKLMDFQPYLGIVTRSLSMAALSLIHFFILAFLVFFCFSIFGYAVFGDVIDKVRMRRPQVDPVQSHPSTP